MKHDSLITVDTPLVNLVMTAHGGSIGFYGFLHSSLIRLVGANVALVQKANRVAANFVHLETNLNDAYKAGSIDTSYIRNLDGGFYLHATFPADEALHDGIAAVESTLTWDDGSITSLRICFAKIEHATPASVPSNSARPDLVGIAMATYNPDPLLFSRQIESLRAQSHDNWFCVISDDGSEPARLKHIETVTSADQRFLLCSYTARLGFYRNFERALATLPDACDFIAFSDQDDIWQPNRLAAHVRELKGGDAECLYSDMRVVHSSGTVLSPSFWVHRGHRYGSVSGLLLANVATGMSMLFTRSLASLTLPFPATPNIPYHDHWIALLAESRGTLRYSPDPRVDYIQHGGNHTGALTPPLRARDATLDGVRRFMAIIWMPFSAVKDPEANKAKIHASAFWSDLEPVRLRILIASLLNKQGVIRSPAVQAMEQLAHGFGILAMLRAKIDWHDRYRRAVAVQLVIGSALKRLMAVYIRLQRSKAKRVAEASHVKG